MRRETSNRLRAEDMPRDKAFSVLGADAIRSEVHNLRPTILARFRLPRRKRAGHHCALL